MNVLHEVTEEEFNSFIKWQHQCKPLASDHTRKGNFHWYGVVLIAAKWFDKDTWSVSTPDFENYLKGYNMYAKPKSKYDV